MKKQAFTFITALIMLLPVAVLCAGPLAKVYIAPQDVGLAAGITQQFTVIGEDADGNPVSVPTPITWSAAGSSGSITSTGLFTAGDTPGRYWGTVTATVPGGFTCTANVEVYSNEIRNSYVVERSIGSLNAGLYDSPAAIAIDQYDCIYILNRDSNTITRLDTSGSFLSRFELTHSVSGTAAMAVDMDRNIYVLDRATPRVTKYSPAGVELATWGYPGSGGYGEFNNPGDIAVDWNGRIYVADTDDKAVEVYDAQGNPVGSWPVMDSYKELIYPTSVCVDPYNTIWVTGRAMPGRETIVKLNDAGDVIWRSSVIPDGTCTDLAVDTAGSYLSLTGLITKIDSSGDVWTDIGSFDSEAGPSDGPAGIAVDSTGRIYVIDTYGSRVRVFDGTGSLVSFWCSSGSAQGQFDSPSSIAFDSSGNVLVADSGNYRVQKFSATGGFINEFSSRSQKEAAFSCPAGIALDGGGNIYVSDPMNNRVLVYDSTGANQDIWALPEPAGSLPNPMQITAIPGGGFYLADAGTNQIHKLSSSGSIVTSWGQSGMLNGQFNIPVGAAADSSGNVYVTDYGNCRIQKFNSSGNFISSWGTYGTGNGKFVYPCGITCSSTSLYVADSGNCRIQKFSTTGTYSSQLGTRGTTKFEFLCPESVATRTNSIFVADSKNHRIIKFAPAPSRNISVAINSPTVNDTYSTSSQTMTIGGSITGTPISFTWSNDRGGSGNCPLSSPWTVSNITLYPGTNIISVKARSSLYTVTDTIIVYCSPTPETTAPAIQITSPTTGPTYTASGAALTIAGAASDNVGLTSVTWSNSLGGVGTCAGTTSWSADLQLKPGDNYISVVAHDAAGNVAADTIRIINGDVVPPYVAINYPSEGEGLASNSSSILIKGVMSDNIGVTRLTWRDWYGDNVEHDIPFSSTNWQTYITVPVGESWITVNARDAVGNVGSDQVNVFYSPNRVNSVADAKKIDPEETVFLSGPVVTAVFGSTAYVEDQSRQCGIRVRSKVALSGVAVGSRVDVAGEFYYFTAEEKTIWGYLHVTGAGLPIQPLGMPGRTVGGGDWLYDGTKIGELGVTGGTGLNNISLLVRTWGVVTTVYGNYLFIDDGSNLQDGTVSYITSLPHVGIQVQYNNALAFAPGDFVQVTGISSRFSDWPIRGRLIRTRGPEDIVKIASPQP